MSDPPRYTLTIKIEADTPDAIYRALAEIETLILSDCRQRVGVRRDAVYTAKMRERKTEARK